ncbi:MAG TPA: hypothetical protein VN456_00060 [Desulfosporosinus sp.]|nr:hypothetical protein [Desulfosporosinus sp.]
MFLEDQSGYLLKSLRAEELLVFSPELAGSISKEFAHNSADSRTDLSNNVEAADGLNDRQTEVLKLVA